MRPVIIELLYNLCPDKRPIFFSSQQHLFYLQCALTVPQENRVYEIHSATQLPMIMQSKAAGVLNVAVADVTVKVKRVGK